jgi:hypothetical protein
MRISENRRSGRVVPARPCFPGMRIAATFHGVVSLYDRGILNLFLRPQHLSKPTGVHRPSWRPHEHYSLRSRPDLPTMARI